jgi:hypothetical protein
VIATKPSDLQWHPAPLPGPRADLVLLVWVQGTLANHVEKAFPSYVNGPVVWATHYHLPLADLGEAKWWTVLRDEPYRGFVPLADTDEGLA